ncbi:MAG: nitrate-binding protein NasS, partial [Alcanivorax sp.]
YRDAVGDLTNLPEVDHKPAERHAGQWRLPGDPAPVELGPDRLLQVE